MRKSFYTIVLLSALFCSTAAIAQPVIGAVTKRIPKINLGLKIGANFETLNGQNIQNAYKSGLVAGAFVRVYKGSFGVDVEALVNTAQYSFSNVTNPGSTVYKAVYMNVPILLEYRVLPRIWAQLGPQYSPVISFKNNAGTDFKKDVASGYASIVLGGQVILPMHFVAGIRYVLGMTDMNNLSNKSVYTGAWNNRSIQLHVGFRFL